LSKALIHKGFTFTYNMYQVTMPKWNTTQYTYINTLKNNIQKYWGVRHGVDGVALSLIQWTDNIYAIFQFAGC